MGGYKIPIGRLEATVQRAEAAELVRDTRDAKQAKACQCVNPFVYAEPDGERRCMCGREARS